MSFVTATHILKTIYQCPGPFFVPYDVEEAFREVTDMELYRSINRENLEDSGRCMGDIIIC